MSGDIGWGFGNALTDIGTLGTGTITNGLNVSTGSTTTGYCSPCGTSWFGYHYCYHWLTPHEHDYQQATAPHADTLYCRKCGETKRLRVRKGVA